MLNNMIKKLFFLILLCMISFFQGQGQQAVTKAGVPPFTILLTNGNHFGYKNLEKDKALMLIYFAPECDHCRDFIKKLTGKMNEFKKLQIIMVSHVPLPNLQRFYKDFKMDKYPNVKVGTEGNSFLVPGYFRIGKFPFIALFDKKGKLAAAYREVPLLEVLSAVSAKL